MKLTTVVNIPSPAEAFCLKDRIVMLGSCFADNLYGKFADAGFNVCSNPFGTLYNPASILSAVERLDSDRPFVGEDCIEMGAGAGRICSFEHHTFFARPTAEEFLENANATLRQAREFWRNANRVILTLGTSLVWFHNGRVVANCLKRPASEFTREMLSVKQIRDILSRLISSHPEKRFTITVSPIRHLGDGAQINTISKSRLLIAVESVREIAGDGDESPALLGRSPLPAAEIARTDVAGLSATADASRRTSAEYFPAFEIMMDELRDYRFYAEDLVHPSPVAIQYIWERFLSTMVSPADLPAIATNEKAARQTAHRPNLK